MDPPFLKSNRCKPGVGRSEQQGLKTSCRHHEASQRRITAVSPALVESLKDFASVGALIFPQAIQPHLVETLESPFLEQAAVLEISFETFPVDSAGASVFPDHLPKDCFCSPEPGCAAARVGHCLGAGGAQQGTPASEKPFPFRKATQALINKAEPHPACSVKGDRLPIRKKFIDQPCVNFDGVLQNQPRNGFAARLCRQQTVLARPREDIVKHHEPLPDGVGRVQTTIAVVGLTDFPVKRPRADMIQMLVAKSRQRADMTKPESTINETLPESATFAIDMRVELGS